jgi:hypothetical protein
MVSPKAQGGCLRLEIDLMRFALSIVSTLAVGSVALAQEFPDPNPVPQADGTFLWYVGNNTQYPVIQDVLEAVSDGDEVVVREGLYVESLHIDNNEVTIRPFVYRAPMDGPASFESVTFLNPTEGFNNNNGWAMKMEGGRGTYVGRPRQFTELSNGLDVETRIQPRDTFNYAAAGGLVEVPQINKGIYQTGASGTAPGVIRFQSRTVDDVAILSDSGLGTFHGALITSMQGSGGGIMVSGSDNQTAFVDCMVMKLYATGNAHDQAGDLPVCVIGIHGDSTTRPTFHKVTVENNDSAQYGTVYQNGADSTWSFCDIHHNDSRAADGAIMAKDGRSTWTDCRIRDNKSGRGTFYSEADGSLATDEHRFLNSCFIDNETVTSLYGGVAWVDHAGAAGGQPQIMFSGCAFQNNNGLDFPNPTTPYDSNLETEADYAIHTPYFPEYRIGLDNSNTCESYATLVLDPPAPMGDMNSDGSVDQIDLDQMLELLGTCRSDVNTSGDIEFGDIIEVLSNFGSNCD